VVSAIRSRMAAHACADQRPLRQRKNADRALLAAPRDIFACTLAGLIATKADNAAARKTATGDANVVDLATTIRPKCARSRPEE
jgi:hypothetical protein